MKYNVGFLVGMLEGFTLYVIYALHQNYMQDYIQPRNMLL
jgi:hypothetical protein